MTEREIIKEKVLQIAEMHGLKFQDGKLIRDFNTLNIINFSNGIVQRVLEDDHDTIPQFIDVMDLCQYLGHIFFRFLRIFFLKFYRA